MGDVSSQSAPYPNERLGVNAAAVRALSTPVPARRIVAVTRLVALALAPWLGLALAHEIEASLALVVHGRLRGGALETGELPEGHVR
jgi:hypothetical protein